MRADLQTMEQIDLYLQGKMSVAEQAAFESGMASNPELASAVADQQLFAQSVSRKALLAEIHLVAGGGAVAWYANPYVGIAGVTVVGGIIAAAVYFNTDDTVPAAEQNANTTEQTLPEHTVYADNNVLTADNDTLMYQVPAGGPAARPYNAQDPVGGESPVNDENPGPENYAIHYETVENNDENPEYNGSGMPDYEDTRVRNRKVSFPNGYNAMNAYIKEKHMYPGTAKKEELQANVDVKFVVNREGQISNITTENIRLRDKNDNPLTATQTILNGKIVNLFEDKAIQIVRTMPQWEPATDSQGNAITTVAVIRFNFSLTDGIIAYLVPEEN